MRGIIVFMAICATGAQAQAPTAAGICARLAPQTGLKQQASGVWRANMLGGVGAALFGGSAGASFLVEPIEESTADQAFDKACTQNGPEVTCTVVGPARITVGTKRGNASAQANEGEKAIVGTKGKYLTCRDGG